MISSAVHRIYQVRGTLLRTRYRVSYHITTLLYRGHLKTTNNRGKVALRHTAVTGITPKRLSLPCHVRLEYYGGCHALVCTKFANKVLKTVGWRYSRRMRAQTYHNQNSLGLRCERFLDCCITYLRPPRSRPQQ